MQKSTEATEVVEMGNRQDVLEEMEMAVEQIREGVEALKQVAKMAESEGLIGPTEVYRLERGALSHIEMALSNDHGFLGGNMFTVQDTIAAIQALDMGSCACGGSYEVVDSDGQIACVECGDNGYRMVSQDACPAGC